MRFVTSYAAPLLALFYQFAALAAPGGSGLTPAAGEVVTAQADAAASTGNSTTTPLDAGQTFTGPWEVITGYASISVIGQADVAGTLYADFSTDGGATVARSVQLSDGADGNLGIHSLIPVASHFRVRVVNGGVNQASLDVQTLFHSSARIAMPTSRFGQSVTDYSDALTTRSVMFGKDDGGAYRQVPVDQHGHIEVAVHSPLTAFRDLRSAALLGVVNQTFSYGLNTSAWDTESSGAGTYTAVSGAIEVASGAGATDFQKLKTKKRVVYHPGLGILARFTAAFPDGGAAGNETLAGVGSVEAGWFVGHRKADGGFGFLHRYGGKREIRTLTVTVGAGGAENVTVKLNGVDTVVAVTAGTATATAGQLAKADYSAAGAGWDADQVGATVVFLSRSAGSLGGAYSVASAGTTAGNFAATRTGAVPTEDWTLQAAWSDDVMDGVGSPTNPSGFDLDPTFGNVYALNYQYLGYGPVFLLVESVPPGSNNPTYTVVHTLNWLNQNAYPSVSNPTAPFVLESRNAGAVASYRVRSGSVGVFVEGTPPLHSEVPSVSRSISNLSNSEVPLISFRAPHTFSALPNQVVLTLRNLNLAFKAQTANYTATFRIYKNTTLTGPTAFSQPNTAHAILVDTASTGRTGGTIIFEKTFVTDSDATIPFTNGSKSLEPGTTYTITAAASAGATNIVAATATIEEER